MAAKVLVVGGGAAGWLAALTLKKACSELTVELIESEEIGIVGAGEATTTSFHRLLEKLDIEVYNFIRETESTIKTAVKFDEWHSPTSSYLSVITPWSHIVNDNNCVDYQIYCYVNNIDIRKHGVHKLILENKAPCGKFPSGETIILQKPTFHINAKLTAKYLRKIAEQRGIIRHEGKIIKINGFYPIESVEDDKGNIHKFDFIFDCSGFARLILGKHLKVQWIDFTKNLTVDSAIAFFLPADKQIPPYVNSTAMNYGWSFKVPTQKRYGSGYVYDSRFIDKQGAIDEVEKKLGHKIELVNFFQFKSGRYKDAFVSNCIAFGLASNFLEPMAATNLASVSRSLLQAFLLPGSAGRDIKNMQFSYSFIKDFNNKFTMTLDYNAMSEVYSHYINGRKDNEFWTHYQNIENYPRIIREAYDKSFSGDKFDINLFSDITKFVNHTAVSKMIGNQWFKHKFEKYAEETNLNQRIDSVHNEYVTKMQEWYSYIMDHREFLESL